jgi:hypothetical protein
VRDVPPPARAPLLALGFVALAFGVAGGLARLGIAPAAPGAIAWHGALMASAFFGTLIALERAVALGRLWAYAAPLASGLGGVLLLAGSIRGALALFLVGSAIFGAASVVVFLKQRALHTGVLALGAAALFTANAALAAQAALDAVALGWIAFLALTIGGERLELSRLVRAPRAARAAFVLVSVALFAAALAAPWQTAAGLRLAGVLLVALAAWLARYDIASRTVRSSGLTRYIALCLLAGYAWLAFGGLALAAQGAGRELWDAALHAVLLGFVFSMVFGHAPVILPAVLRVAFPYSAALYGPLALLHLSVALRVAGDLAHQAPWRAAGAAGNAVAIALFILTAAALVATRRAGR